MSMSAAPQAFARQSGNGEIEKEIPRLFCFGFLLHMYHRGNWLLYIYPVSTQATCSAVNLYDSYCVVKLVP